MKATSEKMLNEIYQLTDSQEIKEMVLKIVRAEQSQTKGKFDYYKYVCKDGFRPVMSGVYHESGFKVASNSHVLVAIKEDYDVSELEGKTLLKDGTIIGQENGRYPNWRSVIPDTSRPEYSRVQIDFDKWAELFSNYKADKKIGEEKPYVKVGNGYYNVELFNLFVMAMKRIGVTDFFSALKFAGVSRNGEDIALVMPIIRNYERNCYIL